MRISAIAFEGLERAYGKFERAAGRVASAGLPPEPDAAAGVDIVELSAAFVEMTVARQAYSANLEVLETADRMAAEAAGILSSPRATRP